MDLELVDDQISRQLMGDDLEGLTGLTLNLTEQFTEQRHKDGQQENFDETIDRILNTECTQEKQLIPDSLADFGRENMETPNSCLLSMSSILRMSIKARSSLTGQQQRRSTILNEFKRLTPMSAIKSAFIQSTSPFSKEIMLLQDMSSALFEDDSTTQGSFKKPFSHTLSLFELSGRSDRPIGRFSESAYTFETGVPPNSLLVPGTQFVDPIDGLNLLPTTPTLSLLSTSSNVSLEIPPTQYPADDEHVQEAIVASESLTKSSSVMLSQFDLFAPDTGTSIEEIPDSMTLTAPSLPSFTNAIVSTPTIGLSLIDEEPQEEEQVSPNEEKNGEHRKDINGAIHEDEEVPDDFRFSGHETVILPDSFDDDENPFLDQPTEPRTPIRISEPPNLPSQLPPEEPPVQLEIPRTGRKVKFAPTPVDSSQPPVPMTVNFFRTRADTQELEENLATSLSKLCKQVVSVPRSTVVKDFDERICAEGEIEMKPKTPLKIISRNGTPAKPASAIPLSRIIQAISTPKIDTLKKKGILVKSANATPLTQLVMPSSSSNTPKVIKALASHSKSTLHKRPLEREPPTTSKKTKQSTKYIFDQTELIEGLLVWARWRPQYYTAGVIEGKRSKSRQVWQVRPLHRQSSTLNVSPEHLLPLSLLKSGDSILHIIDRRKYKVQNKTILTFNVDDKGEPIVEIVGKEILRLEDVVIDRNIFFEKHKQWSSQSALDNETLIEEENGMVEELDSSSEDEENRRYSLTDKGLSCLEQLSSGGIFDGLNFVITGSNDKSKLILSIKEHGGSILDDFETEVDKNKTILIADGASASSSCRTPKYFCSVILGIQRLKSSWIDASISKQKLVSKATHRLDPQVSLRSRTDLFIGVHLCFVGSKSYKDSCSLISCFTNATIVDQRKLGSYKDVSVIVVLETSNSLTTRLQATCLAMGHLISEKSWFTDSILKSKILPL